MSLQITQLFSQESRAGKLKGLLFTGAYDNPRQAFLDAVGTLINTDFQLSVDNVNLMYNLFICTGLGTGGGARGAPLGKKGGQHPICPPPPLFMVHLYLPCPQYISLSAAIP